MAINTLQEKFLGQLALVYDSEQRFVEAQQQMMAQATDPMLKAGLEKHTQETQQQVAVLEQVFTMLGEKPQSAQCPICMGLIKSAETGMKEAGTDALRDVAIGGSAALAEHYEMGAYRGLVAQAQTMGLQDVAQLLQQNLQQEEQTAQKLESAAPMMMQKAM